MSHDLFSSDSFLELEMGKHTNCKHVIVTVFKIEIIVLF